MLKKFLMGSLAAGAMAVPLAGAAWAESVAQSQPTACAQPQRSESGHSRSGRCAAGQWSWPRESCCYASDCGFQWAGSDLRCFGHHPGAGNFCDTQQSRTGRSRDAVAASRHAGGFGRFGSGAASRADDESLLRTGWHAEPGRAADYWLGELRPDEPGAEPCTEPAGPDRRAEPGAGPAVNRSTA